ncbi:hypothetical protein KIN34_04000 [Cellulomonas sp. DKR-3]|uniref:Uncharacterized protein n=1 Tax=Cellulomonas fulva TaxID=2835530 RepID=A0ABS5TWI0_9CELL|nr:hypothetical protein [Cellulomonas fulva]MBT0993447.1 hypothetical protein [Cellulomonas fulva]
MSGSPGRRVRGDLVLHPVALVSLGVLLLNDHVLKAAAPGWVTGKLSDVAGLAFFPFLVVALADVLRRRGRPGVVTACVAAVVTAGGFAAVKLAAPMREAFVGLVGWVRFPVDAVLSGAAYPRPLVVVPDASDIVAVLACAAVVLVVVRQAGPRGARPVGPADGRWLRTYAATSARVAHGTWRRTSRTAASSPCEAMRART